MKIVRTVTVDRPLAEVFAYLSDFTTTEEWDPGTVSTTRAGRRRGSRHAYRNVSRFLGRETSLTYVVLESHCRRRCLRLRGENETVVAHDTMSLAPSASGGTELTYRAVFEFKGMARLVAPLAAPAFKRLGDKAEEGLRAALGRAHS